MPTPILEFEARENLAGFRLHRLEVWNWGTFHNKIWPLYPHGHTALLTGANGSGKSTLVDALLTLLVPFHKRAYNQAAGASQKRERTELTYVKGAYGKVRSEDSYGSRIQYLRPKDSYTVLLAQFSNSEEGQVVTLAQIFWTESDLQKFFVVATVPLSIQEHFSQFEHIRELKNRLREIDGVDISASFADYSRRFRKLLGIRSEKALDLFNQTVTIKEVGNLNRFVRDHMLEKAEAQERLNQLQQNYENLNRAYEAIVKAQEQLDKLRPLLDQAGRYRKIEQQLQDLETCLNLIPAYFASEMITLLDEATSTTEQQLAQAEERADQITQELSRLEQEQRDLYIAINKDDLGQQLQQLAQTINSVREWRDHRQKEAEKYNLLAGRLGFPPYNDQQSFYEARTQADQIDHEAGAKLEKLRQQRKKLDRQVEEMTEQGQELRREYDSLQQRQSQIPVRNLELRRRILSALEITEEEIPFAGELIQVKASERAWEGAIERLLHSFGLNLLVPDQHYARFSGYVNRNHLGDRLVFHRVVSQAQPGYVLHPDPEALIYKLDIKPETAFEDWLQAELGSRYDYICCESLERFRREKRAITPSGFIKRGDSLHEKDDRYDIQDRRHYILGWNNRDKLKVIQAELVKLSEAYNKVNQAVQTLEQQEERLKRQQQDARDLLKFDDFAAIHWKGNELELQRLQQRQQELEQSADHLKQLQTQLKEIEGRLDRSKEARRRAEEEVFNFRRNSQEYQRRRQQAEARLQQVAAETLAAYSPQMAANLQGVILTLEAVDQLQEAQRQWYTRQIREMQEELTSLQGRLVRQMTNYKRDYPAETAQVDASVAAIDEFERMLEAIEREDLPRHQKRFRELLNDKVIADIVNFKSALEVQEEEIRENIATLNASLQKIDYSPATYIQLESEPSRDAEIRDFKHMLRDAIPNVAAPDHEASFKKIKQLIDRFQNQERWTAKVTDVRNWLDFSASERYREDGSEKHHYSDSSGKSGGQKAKLAYTILASAIAYQFSLEEGRSRSRTFRFVIVDEAFSKSDETNARYAMELFKKLKLQLLVVTPPKSNDIHVVEPYISAVHFVENTAEENDSRVYNLTIEAYQAQKQRFMQAA